MACSSSVNILYHYLRADNSKEAWDYVSFASTLGGMVINTAGVTLPHGMEHPASGLKNIVHGKGLAAITPVVMDATIESCSVKFDVFPNGLGRKRWLLIFL